MKRALLWASGIFILIQLVPYGHDHSNPPVIQEPAWDSPATRDLFQRACFDCHSNQTGWRWYAYIAPSSWLVENDVDGGRRHLNLSAWDKPQKHAKDIAAEVEQGDMPPWFYLPLHPSAKLSDTEKKALLAGAEKTFGPQDPLQNH